MRLILLIICFLVSFWSSAQETKHRIIWYLPAHETVVNGIAIGPIFEGLDYIKNDSSKSKVNGIVVEILGFGLIMPLMPKSPFFPIDTTQIDTVLYGKTDVIKGVNGLVVSPGGFALNAYVNGINISGIGTSTIQSNGISMAMIGSHFRANGITAHMFNEVVRIYGCQIGLFNHAYLLKGLQLSAVNTSTITKGVQVGLINKTDRLKGIQIGLWNENDKRKTPLINWSF